MASPLSDLEELDYRKTPLGELVLRRRRDPRVPGVDIYEVKLNDEFLMSSLFHAAEVALAELGLADLDGELDVVVGGLGLGYTAATALDNPKLRSLRVIDALAEVIEWHRQGLVPLGARVSGDARCELVHADFFAAVGPEGRGFDPRHSARRFHAVLLDVDHSPRAVLHPRNAVFYTPDGLQRLAYQLHPGGVFALWSNDRPDAEFLSILDGVFASATAHVISFPNPYQDRAATNTVYVARRAPGK